MRTPLREANLIRLLSAYNVAREPINFPPRRGACNCIKLRKYQLNFGRVTHDSPQERYGSWNHLSRLEGQTACSGMPRFSSNASITRQDISGLAPCFFMVNCGPLVEFSERGRTRIVSDPLPPRPTFTPYGFRALSKSLNRNGDLDMTNLSVKTLAGFNYGNKRGFIFEYWVSAVRVCFPVRTVKEIFPDIQGGRMIHIF